MFSRMLKLESQGLAPLLTPWIFNSTWNYADWDEEADPGNADKEACGQVVVQQVLTEVPLES